MDDGSDDPGCLDPSSTYGLEKEKKYFLAFRDASFKAEFQEGKEQILWVWHK